MSLNLQANKYRVHNLGVAKPHEPPRSAVYAIYTIDSTKKCDVSLRVSISLEKGNIHSLLITISEV